MKNVPDLEIDLVIRPMIENSYEDFRFQVAFILRNCNRMIQLRILHKLWVH